MTPKCLKKKRFFKVLTTQSWLGHNLFIWNKNNKTLSVRAV